MKVDVCICGRPAEVVWRYNRAEYQVACTRRHWGPGRATKRGAVNAWNKQQEQARAHERRQTR